MDSKELMMKNIEWYLEYELQYNRPGLLGDISSLLGMLSINIITVNGVENDKRGMLLTSEKDEQIVRLKSIIETMDTINITKLRKPKLLDKLAFILSKYIHSDSNDRLKIRFFSYNRGLL